MCTNIANWQIICRQMPKNIYVFVRRALIFSHSNDSNLKRWNKTTPASCDLCSSNNHTQFHMLSNCPVAAAEGRYTWRHDCRLFTILCYLNSLKQLGYAIYGDLEGYRSSSELFRSLRRDIVLIRRDTIYV